MDVRTNYNSNCPACISIQALIGKEKLETDPANTYWGGGAYQKEVEHLQSGVWPCSDCEGRGVNCMACIGTGMVFLHAPLLIGGVHEKLLSYAYMLLHDYNNNGNGNILELGVDEDCYECGGTGERDCYNCDGGTMDCYRCDGTGEIEDEKGEDEVCSDCDGTGEEDCSDCGGEDWCVECDGSGEFWNENLIRGIKENYQDAIDYIYANANDSQVRYALNQLVQGLESGQLRTTSGMEMFNEANKKLYNDLHDALIYYVINTPNRPVPAEDEWQTVHSAETFAADCCRECGRKEGPYADTVLIACPNCPELTCQHCYDETNQSCEFCVKKQVPFIISPSPTHGKGLFATTAIKKGTEILSTVTMRYLNHSNDSNIIFQRNYFELPIGLASRDIQEGEELLGDYQQLAELIGHPAVDKGVTPETLFSESESHHAETFATENIPNGLVVKNFKTTSKIYYNRKLIKQFYGMRHKEEADSVAEICLLRLSRNPNYFNYRFRAETFESEGKPTTVQVKRSTNDVKKLMAVFTYPDGKTKTTHFGQRGASDYTKHGEKERMERYLERHGGGTTTSTKEDWKDPTTAGALSRWILWNKPSLSASFTDFKKRFNLKGELKVKKSAESDTEEYSEDNRKMQEAAEKIIELLGKPDYTNSRREIYSSLGESYTSDMVYVLEYDVLTNEGSSMGQRMAQKLKQQGTEPWSEDRWTGSPEWPTYAAGPFHQERETFTITVSEANPVVESIVMDLYLYFADKYGVNGTGFEPTFLVVMDEEGNEVTADNLEIDNTWRDSVQGFESEETFGANNIGSLNYPSLLMFNYWKSKLPRLTYEEYVKANNLGYGLEKLLEINSVPEQCEHKNTEPDDVFIFEEDWPLGEVTQYYHIELMWQCPDCTRVGSASADYETDDEFWGTDPSMYAVFWEDKTRIIPFRGDHPDNYRELPSTNEGSWSSVFGAETFEAPMNSMNQRRQIPITTPFVCSGGQSGGGCGELIDENEEWLISRLDGASYVLCNDCVDNSYHFYWVCNACGDRFCDEDLYDDGTAEDREIEDVMNSVVCNNCVASGSPFRAEDDFDEQGEPPEYITWKGKDYIYDDFEATMATPEGILYLYKTYHEPTGTVTYPIIKLYNYEGKIKEWTYDDQKEFDIEVQAQLSSIQGKVRSHKRYW